MSQPSSDLDQALKEAQGQWEETLAGWRDHTAQQFAGRYWSQIEAEVAQLILAFAAIEAAINRIDD